jgi:hypothetical protein
VRGGEHLAFRGPAWFPRVGPAPVAGPGERGGAGPLEVIRAQLQLSIVGRFVVPGCGFDRGRRGHLFATIATLVT